jgi:DNA-binding MarR family transcriptional regulator
MTETERSEGGRASATPEELVVRLRGLTRGTQEYLAGRAREAGLGSTDFIALIRTTAVDGVTGAQLAQAFGMRSSSVTGLADRLEAKGLIARRAHPTDRRSVVLQATRRGRSLVDRALGPLIAQLAALTDELGADERAIIDDFLAQVEEALRASPRPSRGAKRTRR